MPMDKAAIGILVASAASGVLAYIKEILGWKPTQNSTTTTPTTQ